MKSYILFIRHGITEGIQKRWFYGWTDLPVVEEGLRELERYKKEGVYPKLPDDTEYYTTGFIRTTQTLKAIFGDVPYREIHNLKEINFGEWECLTFDQLAAKDGGEEWLNDATETFCFPGGESMQSYRRRIARGLEELRGYHRLQELAHRHSGKDAASVLVCHGGSISAIMTELFPEDRDNFWNWTPKVGLGYKVFFEDGEPVSFEPLTAGAQEE